MHVEQDFLQAINEALNMYSIRRTFFAGDTLLCMGIELECGTGTVNAPKNTFQTKSVERKNGFSEIFGSHLMERIVQDTGISLTEKSSYPSPRGGSGSLLSPPIPQDF